LREFKEVRAALQAVNNPIDFFVKDIKEDPRALLRYLPRFTSYALSGAAWGLMFAMYLDKDNADEYGKKAGYVLGADFLVRFFHGLAEGGMNLFKEMKFSDLPQDLQEEVRHHIAQLDTESRVEINDNHTVASLIACMGNEGISALKEHTHANRSRETKVVSTLMMVGLSQVVAVGTYFISKNPNNHAKVMMGAEFNSGFHVYDFVMNELVREHAYILGAYTISKMSQCSTYATSNFSNCVSTLYTTFCGSAQNNANNDNTMTNNLIENNTSKPAIEMT